MDIDELWFWFLTIFKRSWCVDGINCLLILKWLQRIKGESFVDKLFKKKKKKASTAVPKQSTSEAVSAPLNIMATAKFKFEATRDDELNLNKGYFKHRKSNILSFGTQCTSWLHFMIGYNEYRSTNRMCILYMY